MACERIKVSRHVLPSRISLKGRFIATVFIDLKRAIDTVDDDILLKKLEKYGVIGLEHGWFSSYLINRQQLCRVNGVTSNIEEI